MILATVTISEWAYWTCLALMWIGGFGIGISVGSNIAKRRIKHHIDQESVRQL